MVIDNSVQYAHVADYVDKFAEEFAKTLEKFIDYETDVHYSTVTQPDGRVLFSALIIGRNTAAFRVFDEAAK
jgi:hypothetical protein